MASSQYIPEWNYARPTEVVVHMRYIIDTEMNLCNDISPILFTPSIEPELKVGNHIFTHKIVTYSISINSHGRFIPFFLRLIGFLRVGIADGESGRDTGFADWFGVEEETASSPFTFFELGSPIVRPEETQHRFCRWV